jgi:hypothetical protein
MVQECLPVLQQMSSDSGKRRRVFRWPREVRDLVRAYQRNGNTDFNDLVARVARLSGNPRDACLRLVRNCRPKSNQEYREWTESEQQQLLDLIACEPVAEVAKVMRRSQSSIRSMLHRLGASTQIGPDWFTPYALSEALHVRSEEIQKWMDRGWLKPSTVETGRLKKTIIRSDAFSEFCETYHSAVVGRRLSVDRLEFVRTFVFSRGSAESLPGPKTKVEAVRYGARGRGKIAVGHPVRGAGDPDDTSSVA